MTNLDELNTFYNNLSDKEKKKIDPYMNILKSMEIDNNYKFKDNFSII
jgi:hypothetical protein